MKNKRISRSTVILLTCLLAVPTVPCLMYNHPMNDFVLLKPYFAAGLRPILRLITAPLGCLTFGLSGMAIDVGLIYLAQKLVDGFVIPEFLCALLTAMLINSICSIFAR